MHKHNYNIVFYLFAAGLFILLKWGFKMADHDRLAFLLWPTDRLVGIFAGATSVYLPDKGYFYPSLNILIDKSCSGYNFWILSFLLFTFLAVKYMDKTRHKMLSVPAALLCAYLLTLFANASRIAASILVQAQTRNLFVNQQPLIHEAVGIITNLSFLILTYYGIEKLLIQKRVHAKFA